MDMNARKKNRKGQKPLSNDLSTPLLTKRHEASQIEPKAPPRPPKMFESLRSCQQEMQGSGSCQRFQCPAGWGQRIRRAGEAALWGSLARLEV